MVIWRFDFYDECKKIDTFLQDLNPRITATIVLCGSGSKFSYLRVKQLLNENTCCEGQRAGVSLIQEKYNDVMVGREKET